MESIRYLIKFFIKVAFAFFIIALVWWLVSLVSPAFNLHSIVASRTASSTSKDWLPSPRTYAGLFNKKNMTPNEYTNVYVPPPAFNQYGLNNDQYQFSTYSYVTYTSTGTAVINGSSARQGENSQAPVQSKTTLSSNRVLSIRNLSIYEGGHVYTGLAFVGEAKASMFRDGKFPIVVVDQAGKVVGVSAAIATTNWTVPGWVRFETKITYPLPVNVPCTMIFEEALTQQERNTRQPLRVPIQERCN